MKTYCAKIIYANPKRVCPDGYLISEKTLFNYNIKNGERVYFSFEKLMKKAISFMQKHSALATDCFCFYFEIIDNGFKPVPFFYKISIATDDKKKGG